MIRAGIVGFDNIEPVHAGALSTLGSAETAVELAAICDTDRTCPELARAAYPGAELSDDFERMLAEG